jgi:ureidoacrylate peracid hydrolase
MSVPVDRAVRPEVLRTLEDKVNPGHTALLVVDVQNDFCHENGGLGEMGNDMSLIQESVPRLAATIEVARANNVPVIFLRIVQSPDTNSAAWESLEEAEGPRLVMEDTWGADYYEGIGPVPGEREIIKRRHSGFNFTPLDSYLRSKAIKTVVVGGVASNVCVEATARDAADYDYYVVVLRDGSGAVRSELHDAALYTIENYIGITATCDEVKRVWSQQS